MNWQDTIPFVWNVETITNEQILLAIREWRNRELSKSDWTQLADVTLSNKNEWVTYRQELRDMMAQSDDPKKIVFPEPPK